MSTAYPVFAGPDAAPALTIGVERVEAMEFAAVPTLRFQARIGSAGAEPIRAITLASQIRIAAGRRRYDDQETRRLRDLFGTPDEWSRNLRSLLWAQTSTQVPAFTGETVADILVTCTYDFEVAAAKYLHALVDGEVPVEFLFSGTVFYSSPTDGLLRIAPIARDVEAEFRMPVRVWAQVMEQHFPGSAWLRLDRDVFDRLRAYQARHTLTSWSDVVGRLLRADERAAGGG